jgi:A/G-specific adenine glycosylase
MPESLLARALLDWYALNARVLPWRETNDPYAILVSEFMLQQTRVETVIPYYENWLVRFPTLTSLADASQQEVLRAWEGLGYYSRARSLHAAAGQIVMQFGGVIPVDVQLLRALPGIGAYTAAALSALIGGRDEPAVDANVARVAARLYDIQQSITSQSARTMVETELRAVLPKGRAGEFNQALMDLGSQVCVSKTPRCAACPLSPFCLAFQRNTQAERPVKSTKKAISTFEVAAAVIWREGKVLIARRPQKAMLGGLWEFPGGKLEVGETAQQALVREIHEELDCAVDVGDSIGTFRHAYTHFKVIVQAFWCTLESKEPHALEASELAWADPSELDEFAMGKVDRLIARRVVEAGSV